MDVAWDMQFREHMEKAQAGRGTAQLGDVFGGEQRVRATAGVEGRMACHGQGCPKQGSTALSCSSTSPGRGLTIWITARSSASAPETSFRPWEKSACERQCAKNCRRIHRESLAGTVSAPGMSGHYPQSQACCMTLRVERTIWGFSDGQPSTASVVMHAIVI